MKLIKLDERFGYPTNRADVYINADKIEYIEYRDPKSCTIKTAVASFVAYIPMEDAVALLNRSE